ncbi:cupredoxin domain-containing protein [Salinibacter sp.]|uniref:cupredoxin domain-containing protein n=1 Tax=Salinibacter sp. TaxID=2065818 RepID=UPI0021E78838|nr:plastocyanin/azurin family copper-binding protein [Salinibacter sp.]
MVEQAEQRIDGHGAGSVRQRLPDGATPFHSGDLEPEATFEYTFETPGRYRYFCVPHEAAMRGVVIVEPVEEDG